ncbi:unnamed protein product, partial [Rotaria magnacalcarata]
NRIFDG